MDSGGGIGSPPVVPALSRDDVRVCCSIRFQTAKPSDAASRPRGSESKFLSCREWKSVRHSGPAPSGASTVCKIAHRAMTPEFERRAASGELRAWPLYKVCYLNKCNCR
jgi:hypothetical protein